MKVSKWYNNRDIRIEEVETPKPKKGEILVKVLSCGICGSDIVEWYRLPRAPLVQGHEIGGEVVQAGKSVKNYKPGDRVFVAPKVPCMKCRYCKNGKYPLCSNVDVRMPGGFAEYVLIPGPLVDKGTYRLPKNITDDQSTFIEPLACVVRAHRLAEVKRSQSVAVIGCGISGLLHVKLAKAKGCTVIATDTIQKRLSLAKQFGAKIAIEAKKDVPGRLTAENKKPADVVLVCTSATSAIDQAWKCVDKGGVIVFFAVPEPEKEVKIPINDFWRKEIKILTSYYCGPPDIEEAMELLQTGRIKVDDLITHRLPLKETARGFHLVLDGKESIKVIIRPND